MFSKIVLVACALAGVAQIASSACIGAGLAAPCGLANNGLGLGCGGLIGNGLGYGGLAGAGLGYGAGLAGNGVASTGGGLPVASASPIAPVGVSVLSENAYEGSLSVGGNLPFLGTVGLEGVLPTAGAGAVSYGCGNGAVGIGSEGPIATGIASAQTFAPSIGALGAGIGGYGAGLGYGAGYGAGLGYGAGFGYGAGINGINGYGIGNGCGCGAIY